VKSRALLVASLLAACTRSTLTGSPPPAPTSARLAEETESPKPERSNAIEAHERACSLGLASGCNSLGVALLDGKGVSKDEARAAEILRKACELGSDWGCFNWAFLEESGTGVRRDMDAAVRDYDKSCKSGIAQSCNRLGLLLIEPEFAKEVTPAPQRALELFEQACDAGVAVACGNAGYFWESVKPGAGARAVHFLELACNGDQATSCAELAHRLARGDGAAKDTKRAWTLFDRACALDPATGCHEWGLALVTEDSGFQLDWSRGRELIQRACKAGSRAACNDVKAIDEDE
jgi:TPR repeat protein